MLKKGIGILLTLCMLVSVLPVGVGATAATETEEKLAGELKISDTFSAPTTVDVNGKNGWSVSGTGLSAQQVVDPANASNRVLKLTGEASNSGAASKSFTEQTGKQKISLRLNASAAANSSLKLTLYGTEITFGKTGNIATVTAGTESMQGYYNDRDKVFVGAYSTTAWFEFGAVVDADGKMDLFLGGNQINSKKISGTAGNLSKIDFAVAGAGSWYVDDIKTASYQASAENIALDSPTWQTIQNSEVNFNNWKYTDHSDGGKKKNISEAKSNVYVEAWRYSDIQYWSAADGFTGTSNDSNRFVNCVQSNLGDNTWMKLTRLKTNSSASEGTGGAYYNFKPTWNTVRPLGGKSKVSFQIYSPKHSASDTRYRYFGLADKDGNHILLFSFNKNNLAIHAVGGGQYGTLVSGNTIVTLVMDWDAKTITAYADGAVMGKTGYDFTNLSTGKEAPAKIFFSLQGNVGSNWSSSNNDDTYIRNITVSQWNEYATEGLWTAGITDDMQYNYANGSAFAKTADWTPSGRVVWSVGDDGSAVKLQADGSMQRTLGLQKGLVMFRAEVKSDSGKQTFTLKDYNDGGTPNVLSTFSLENGQLKKDDTAIATVGNDWFTLQIALNTETGEYWLFNGEQQLNSTALTGTASTDVQYFLVESESGAVSMKNFAVSAGSDTAAYTIRDVVMQKGEGEYVNRVDNGVTVKEIKIAKSRDAGAAKAIVAVYKDDILVKTQMADLAASYSVGSVITLPLEFTVSEGAGDYSLKAFLWNDTEGLKPLANSYEDNKKIQVLIAGDSIAQTYTWYWHYPMTGYGQTLESYLDTSKVEVNNFAKSGTSTNTFESMGLFDNILYAGRSGDYVTIQFAHNDQGQNVSIDTYKANLRSFVTRAKAKGLNPIFITSPERNTLAQDVATLGEYPTAMKDVATETDTPVIDLNDWSKIYFGGLSQEEVALAYMHIKPNDDRYFKTSTGADNYSDSQYNKDTATIDNTHFTVYGAHLLSQTIARKLENLEGCGLSAYALPNKTNPEDYKVSAE